MTRAEQALQFLKLLCGSSAFFVGYKFEGVFGKWRAHRRYQRQARKQSVRIARKVDESRQYFASVKNGRTQRQMPLDVSNRGMW